uniref:Uncharacterized protein n=1 Tax=Candidatus Kentrum sp. LPFa TaxID=2126335 RepID=A0A450W1U9_9GAMM|nr:MAG: hypothetical protein BECKLPF1236A_GA0070988_1004715 [Candidatus Kentron sp. LPFa]VFK30470.1 MAG: hypothetical protein BECKLPF1236C_GA0070990_101119 [Candidatus Kentron sp. LPFa]
MLRMHKISPSGRDDISLSLFTFPENPEQNDQKIRESNPAKPEPKIFVHYSPVIPLISGNPVTNISLIFLDRFVEDFLGNGLKKWYFIDLFGFGFSGLGDEVFVPATLGIGKTKFRKIGACARNTRLDPGAKR